MPRLIIVRGLPGSGKSTYAKSLGVHHVEADMFWMNNGVYQFPRDDDPDKLDKITLAHRWSYNQTRQAMWYGMDVVVSNTFVAVERIVPYVEMANFLKYDVTVVTMKNDFGSVHGVPDEVIEEMRSCWEEYPGETIIRIGEQND